MRLNSAKLLSDMQQAAEDASEMVFGFTFELFESDKKTCRAVERMLEIVGEALSQLHKIDPSTAEKISSWRGIIGFRNVLIHGYANIDNERTWDVLTTKLPVLLNELKQLLAEPIEP